jgi:hypothetical protein
VPAADQSLLLAPTASPQHSAANQDLIMVPRTARVGSSSGVLGKDAVVSAANVHDLPAAVCGSSAMRPFRLAKAPTLSQETTAVCGQGTCMRADAHVFVPSSTLAVEGAAPSCQHLHALRPEGRSAVVKVLSKCVQQKLLAVCPGQVLCMIQITLPRCRQRST